MREPAVRAAGRPGGAASSAIDVGPPHGGARRQACRRGRRRGPLISTIPAGSSASAVRAGGGLASAFGFMAGLGSSGRPRAGGEDAGRGEGDAARAAVEAILILVISIPLNRVLSQERATTAEAGPPVAASDRRPRHAAGTAAEALAEPVTRRPPGRSRPGGSDGP